MEDTKRPKAVFHGELCQSKRDKGTPRKHYKEQLRRQIHTPEIPEKDWEIRARVGWKALIKQGSAVFKATKRETAEERCRKRKASAVRGPPSQGFPCPGC